MRIQILPLPSNVVGEVVEEPFALVVDQYEGASDETSLEYWSKFGAQCGARSTLVTPATVEVVDRYAEPARVEQDPVARFADPVTLPRDKAEACLATLETALQVLDGVGKVRDLQASQGQDGNWDQSAYMRGMFNALELALSILEGERDPQYRDAPEGGYLCDKPTPDMSGPEFAPVPAEG